MCVNALTQIHLAVSVNTTIKAFLLYTLYNMYGVFQYRRRLTRHRIRK